jgi:Domain of unknown function (DUF4396)
MHATKTSHDTATVDASCHAAHAQAAPHAAHSGHAGNGWSGAASITLHCLTGCAIGELTGLTIGVSLGWHPNFTIALAVVLSFVSGYALTLVPMLRRGAGFLTAFRTVWLGEAISIGVMELVMNVADYEMGGMRGVSLTSQRYWISFAIALVAGFLAAWPVNLWMLRRNLKRCH